MTGATVSLAQGNTVRLVSSARLRAPSLAALADTQDEMAKLVSLESATHGRLQAMTAGLEELHPKELVFGVPNHTFINAAFCYPRPGGNRFNSERRGAWYSAFDVETSLAEVKFHLTRALAETDLYENCTDYAELFADFIGLFHDLRGIDPLPDCLSPDPGKGYPAGQALAEALIEANEVSGIVYPSVRRADGTCLAALYPAVVQNLQQGGLWRLTWSGDPEPSIVRLA